MTKAPFCPECDKGNIHRRTAALPDQDDKRRDDARWYCNGCKEGFEEPNWREPRHVVNKGLTAELLDADAEAWP